jgi:hypothetical protein
MTAEWAAVVVAFGALLISGIAVAVSRQAAGYAKGQADSSERQAIAAEASVEYMRRQIELMEEQAAAALVPLEVTARLSEPREGSTVSAPYVVPWSLIQRSKGTLLLTNGSAEPAYDVDISFDVDPARVETTHWDRIDPRATASVRLIRAFGASPDAMTVRWRRTPDGDVLDWTTAL